MATFGPFSSELKFDFIYVGGVGTIQREGQIWRDDDGNIWSVAVYDDGTAIATRDGKEFTITLS